MDYNEELNNSPQMAAAIIRSGLPATINQVTAWQRDFGE